MQITRSILIPAAAFGLMLGSAHAADEPSRDVPNFNQMDKNNDGALSRSEASLHRRLSAHFDQVDDNGDGRLTRGEYLQIMARQDLFSLRDSLAEFINPEGKPPLAMQQYASAMDKQASETESLPMAVSPQLVRNVQDTLQAKGIDAGPVDGIWGPRTHQALREFQDGQGLDTTGQLDRQTLVALGIEGEETASTGGSTSSAAPGFDQADKDKNGYVSREEFKSTLAQR